MPRLKAHNEKELRALAKALNVPLRKLQSGPLEVLLKSSLYGARCAVWVRERARNMCDRLGASCESHIERLMLWALLGEHDFTPGVGQELALMPRIPDDVLVIQPRVAGFTADFAIIPGPNTQHPRPKTLVIECDGHDYHGGSGHRRADVARQARDRKRDRDIQKAGHVVLRFTGSQIVNDPRACALEVLSFLNHGATEPQRTT